MSADKILGELKKGHYRPLYWLEGEEEFFIDQVIHHAEHHILSEAESGFNLTIFYGRDAAWPDVINACRRYPMFSERQVVIIKEAQAMREIEKLEAYVQQPLSSTALFVAYKGKKLDGRTKLAKSIKDKGVLLQTKKMYDNELPEWVSNLIRSKGLTIGTRALRLLVDSIGNDLSRLSNEIDKLQINLGEQKEITEDSIEKYIGVSKEFNVFELQHALATRDLPKAVRIIQYFGNNPKAAPLPLLFPSLYNFFSKVLLVHHLPRGDEKSTAQAIGVHSYFIRDYMGAAQRFSPRELEMIILLLHRYNLKSIGMNDSGTADAELLKEFAVKGFGISS